MSSFTPVKDYSGAPSIPVQVVPSLDFARNHETRVASP